MNSSYRGLNKDIGMVYLCYAQMVTEYSKQEWIDHLKEKNFVKEEVKKDFVESVAALYEEISKIKEQ